MTFYFCLKMNILRTSLNNRIIKLLVWEKSSDLSLWLQYPTGRHWE